MRHGTNDTYCAGKCRCPLCREAHRIATRRYRERHGGRHAITDTYEAIATPGGWLCIGCWDLFDPRAIPNHERVCLSPGTSHDRYSTVAA